MPLLTQRVTLSDDAELWIECDACHVVGELLLNYPADVDPTVLMRQITAFLVKHSRCRGAA